MVRSRRIFTSSGSTTLALAYISLASVGLDFARPPLALLPHFTTRTLMGFILAMQIVSFDGHTECW